MPAATPTSTAPPSSTPRRKLWRLVSLVVTAIVLVFVGIQVAAIWRDFRATPITVSPRWGIVALSCIVVLLTYGVLIETWRRILATWGEHLSFGDATRIQCIAKLGIYVPGKIWQIGALGVMAEQKNISPAAAAGSAVVSTIMNIACGLVIAIVTGWNALDAISKGHGTVGIALTIVLFGGLFLLPVILPVMLRLARRMTGRDLELGTLPQRAMYVALVGNVLAWIMYGIAFQLFTVGILGSSAGRTTDYVAAWAVSYVVGYLAFAIPGGMGVREVFMTRALTTLGLASQGPAAVVAITSRIWLTGLELLPAFFFLARRSRQRTPNNDRRDVSNS